jgi:hypothetical protein
LLEEVSHDVSMSGRDSGPHWAWDRVLQLHEGGDEQRVLLALDQDFSLQPKAGAGNEEAKSGYCAGAGRCRRPDSWSALRPSGKVLIAGFIVLYIRACTYVIFDEPLNGAAKSPAVKPG